MMRLTPLYVASTIFALLVCVAADLHGESARIQFNRDIRPLLSAKCFNCHGPDEESREADLRLDTREGAFAERDEAQTLVPGEPDESELYLRITSTDPDEQMPPADSEHRLTPEEISLFKIWIEQGVEWQRHWSFIVPTRPELPGAEQPSNNAQPIDRFIRRRLQEKRLAPAAEADRPTLLRRLTFDLTGLPPNLEEVRAFVNDTSPEAYGKVVDRLIDSKHYGEHMARFWLDAARYGDTHGLHLDNYREMWPYRDWVIGAFNANMPFDQFLVEQLAGDLLPNATLQQKVASGFNRCHVSTNEGGSIDEEVYVRNVVDRVSTMGTVCLGMTIGCAVCHDHKFDPVSQQEFYQLFAFFNSLDGQSMDGNVKDPAPTLRVPTAKQDESLAVLNKKIKSLDTARTDRSKVIEPEFQAWLAQESLNSRIVATVNGNALLAHCNFDETEGETFANSGYHKGTGKLIGSPPPRTAGKIGKGFACSYHGHGDLGNICNFMNDEEASLGAWVKFKPGSNGPVISKLAVGLNKKGYELSVSNQQVVVLLSNRHPGYVIEVKTTEKVLEPDTWHHIFFTYSATGKASGVRVFVDGVLQTLTIQTDSLTTERYYNNDKSLLLGRSDTGLAFAGGSIDELRIYKRRLDDSEVQAIYLVDQLASAGTKPIGDWTSEEIDDLKLLYLAQVDPVYTELTGQFDELREKKTELESLIPTTLVFRERSEPREAFVLNRGEYDQRKDKVERKTPGFLPPLEDGLSQDRLGLAKWLVSPKHPLTSRVAVNRLWQQVFGIGLVETSEDFGSQGTPPSHPELLDWLTVEFRDGGWDVKALMKRLVMSSTYRQTSKASPALHKIDPKNRLLARGPRYRLDAEMLRDQALSLSGLLVNQVGGPSVKPPQPQGLWKSVGYSGSNTVDFRQDIGAEKIYRRSMYTFWKRSSPPPQMSTFDAPSRESCQTRRERTNTPLQALLLMNEEQYVEAARCFAQRILIEAAPSARERIVWAFEKATMRSPEALEIDELLTAYNHFRLAYAKDIPAAKRLITLGDSPSDERLDTVELATWTMMANVLLNLDEVVTKE